MLQFKNTYLLLFVLLSFHLFSQTKRKSHSSFYKEHEVAADIGAFYSPIMNKDFIGFNFDVKYYWSKRFSTGGSICYSTKRTSDNFGYVDSLPRLDYTSYGWINEASVVKTQRFKLNITLNNAFSFLDLVDRGVQVKSLNSSSIFFSSHPKSIITNYYYIIEPGLDILLGLDKDRTFYFTLKSKYRFAFGDTKFGPNNALSTYYIGMCLTTIIK